MPTDNDLTRRDFIVSSMGYALAVSPITAFAISTSADGLIGKDIVIPVNDGGKMPAYVAMPKSGRKLPCIMVVQEIFGLHEYIKDVCRRLANAGYVAVAPSLYFRQGDATKIADINQLRSTIVNKVKYDQVLSDLDATASWLQQQKNTDATKLGITGFCWGGTATWMYAAHNPKVKAGVAWYGKIKGEVTANQSKFPIDIAKTLKVPVLGLYGEKDAGIPLEDLREMERSLAQGSSGARIIIYPGAQHGFHADYRPAYDEKSAKDGWEKMLAFFRKQSVK